MAFNLNNIRGALRFGGARPNLFQIQLTNPVDVGMGRIVPFLVQSAGVPASTIGVVNVPYFGRFFKVAGTRTFDSWRVTVINDEDFAIRHGLERWHNAINSLSQNRNTLGTSAPNAYKTDATVTQFAKTGEPIRTYRLYGIFPSSIDSMELDWSSNDQIQNFSAQFAYDWFEVVPGRTGAVR